MKVLELIGGMMGEPTPPKAMVFKSSEESTSQKPVDYFAEQNQQRAQADQRFSKVRKWGLIAGGIALLILIVLVVVLIILKAHSGPVVSDDAPQDSSTLDTSGNSQMSAVNNLTDQVTEVFEPTYSLNADGEVEISGDLEAAEATYAAALANPANRKRIDTIYLSQIIFYASLSDNQRIVEIAEKVNPDNLNTAEKIKFYNLTYLAYAALGNQEQADNYYKLTRQAANQVNGIGG